MKILRLVSCASLALLGVDCEEGGGQGAVTFTTWGEEYIEQGIPAADFEDGYSVEYSKFLISIGNIRIADDGGEVAAGDPSFYLVDHAEPGVKDLIRFDGLDEKNHTLVSYETSPSPDGKYVKVGKVTDADVQLMASNEYHAYVEGTLTDPNGASKTFKWGFSVPTLLDECEGERDGKLTQGVVVTDGGDDPVELTVHGDHLFYDDLQSASAVVRGEAMFMADANMDGAIELAELAATPLPAVHYGTGGASDVNDLGAFVTFLSRTLGHFRGEGECFVKNPE
jgi:hypothetical protein